jgi:hypothetical protein
MGAALMVTFDATINLGHIITFFGFIVGGLLVVWALKYDVRYLSSRMEIVEGRFGSVEGKLERFGTAITALAVQEERMNNIEKRLTDLQHGRGFVLDGLPRTMRTGD